MRFPLKFSACCVVAVGLTAVAVAQSNTDAQEKALQALRQQYNQGAAPAAKPLNTQPAAVQKSPAPAAAATVPAAAPTSQEPLETEQERKARIALDNLRRGNAPAKPLTTTPAPAAAPAPKAVATPAPTPAPKASPAPAVVAAPAAKPATQPAPATTAATPSSNLDPQKEEAARKALANVYNSAPKAEPAAPAAKPAMAAAPVAPQATPAPGAVASTPAAQAQAKPHPLTNKEKLNLLLEQYMANEITPREYHESRAKIVSSM